MSKALKITLCIALSFMFCFISVGYAALTTSLSIKANIEYEVPQGLFIIAMEPEGNASYLDVNKYEFTEHSTMVETSLSRSQWSGNQAGSVTYKITVLNNTDRKYAYRDMYYQTNLSEYNNNVLSDSSGRNNINVTTSFPNGSTVEPNGGQLVFYATYTLGRSLSTNTTYKNLVNFQFGINVDSEEAARDAVHSKFIDILNTSSTYTDLIDALDNKYDGVNAWKSNYVGNVSDATDSDSMLVNTIFAGQLQMIINGVKQPATVMIKHENLDNNTQTGDDYVATANGNSHYGYGCEMTLYLTTKNLGRPGEWVEVYVTVFTCDRDVEGNLGQWYQVGDTYKGTANVVSYDGDANGSGSFVTDNWVADAATYSPTDEYSYTVSSGATLKSIMQYVDSDATKELQRLLDRAYEIISDTTYAGTGIDAVEDAYAQASRFYTLDENRKPIANSNITRVQLLPAIRNLKEVIDVAEEEIQKQTEALLE